MKKKILVLSIALAVLTGCGSTTTTVTKSETKAEPQQTTVTDNRDKGDLSQSDTTEVQANDTAEVSEGDFSYKGYLYENSIGDSLYFVAVTNNGKASAEVSGNATALDSANNTIGADSMSIDIVGPGETSIGYFYFDGVSGINSVEYQLSFSKESYYKPVINNLEINESINDRNVTIQAINKGDYSAQFVEAYALFMDASDNVVYYSSTYLTDGDSEIKPGASIAEQIESYEDFDHVEVFFTGRSDGSGAGSSVASSSVSDSDIDVKAYPYQNSIGDTLYFLVITNNSDKILEFNANSTAYDSAGNTIGADSASIDVLGPGETTITYFYYEGVTGIDKVDYQISYGDSSYYDPVISNLSVQESINNSNVVVTVTNNGSYPAQFVEAYALFLDSAGNVVNYTSQYITDDDSEIKPGATISEQLSTYDSFDQVEVYFTGRHSNF